MISLPTHRQHFSHHLSGSDGVFDINSSSGCITLTTYPSMLKNELYEIKVKVTFFLFGIMPPSLINDSINQMC